MPPDVEQTNPSDVGSSTTEFKLAAIAGVVGAVLAGLVAAFAALQQSMPDVGWIASAVVILGSLTSAVLPLLRYVSGRSQVKVAALNAQAAQVIASTPTAAAIVAQLSQPPRALPLEPPSF